jgi:hypothetical protein
MQKLLIGQPRPSRARRLRPLLICLCACGLALPVTASAVSFTWSGGGGFGAKAWSNSANWIGGIAPSNSSAIESLSFPRISGGSVSTNDLSGLSVNQLAVDDSQGYALTGNGLTLGSGGLNVSASELPPGIEALLLGLPLTLSASQTWNVSAPNPTPLNIGIPDIFLSGGLSGETSDLSINLNSLTWLWLGANPFVTTPPKLDDELGNVTINGTVAVSGAESQHSIVELPARFNASDGHSLTLREVQAESGVEGSATGPITAIKSRLGLSGSAIGAITATESGLDINGRVASLSLDTHSGLSFTLDSAGSTPGTDYDQLTSGGPVDLGGSELGLGSVQNAENKCPSAPIGQVYTLISTTGSLSGSFTNAPEGATLSAECLDTSGATFTTRLYYYRINYSTSGSPETVTATAIEPPASGSGGSPTPPHEEPKSIATCCGSSVIQPGAITSAQIVAWLKQLAQGAAKQRIGALLKHGGLVLPVMAPETGVLTIQWWQVPAGAKLAKRAKPVLIASGKATYAGAGSGKLSLRLTATGKRLLRHARRVKLVERATFVPRGESATSVQSGLVVRR